MVPRRARPAASPCSKARVERARCAGRTGVRCGRRGRLPKTRSSRHLCGTPHRAYVARGRLPWSLLPTDHRPGLGRGRSECEPAKGDYLTCSNTVEDRLQPPLDRKELTFAQLIDALKPEPQLRYLQ